MPRTSVIHRPFVGPSFAASNTQRFARYLVDLVKHVPRAQIAKLSAEQRRPLEVNYDEIAEQVKALLAVHSHGPAVIGLRCVEFREVQNTRTAIIERRRREQQVHAARRLERA